MHRVRLIIEAIRPLQLASLPKKNGRTSCAGSSPGLKPGEYPVCVEPGAHARDTRVRRLRTIDSANLAFFGIFGPGRCNFGLEGVWAVPSTTCPACAQELGAPNETPPPAPDDSRAERHRIAAATTVQTQTLRSPSPSELDDDEYATNPPNLGFFSTGGGASANRRFSTTGAGGDGGRAGSGRGKHRRRRWNGPRPTTTLVMAAASRRRRARPGPA